MSTRTEALSRHTMGKPPETVGRKATGTKAQRRYVSLAANYRANRRKRRGAKLRGLKRQGAMPARLRIISKPLETAGRKAMGAKVPRYYASPAAGYFASESFSKERKIVV